MTSTTPMTDDLHAQRLHHIASRTFREADGKASIRHALDLANHPSMPNRAINLMPEIFQASMTWPSTDMLCERHRDYLESLRVFDAAVRKERGLEITDEVRAAFETVLFTSRAVEALGWAINSRQNLHSVLIDAEFGLSGDALECRYSNLPDHITLEKRLDLLGGLTFYKLSRKSRAGKGTLHPKVLWGDEAKICSEIVMTKNDGAGRRYASDWHDDDIQGHSFKVFSD